MRIPTAITRKVSLSMAACELEFLERREIDGSKAEAQHHQYEVCLAELGLRVVSLPADPDFPDGVFVEDPAIVLDEIAIITRMGAEVRRKEADSLAEALSRFRPLHFIEPPATLEGGDVLRVGRTLYAGVSRRSNPEGSQQLARLIAPFGYRVVPVEVTGCLHLKSACCYLGDDAILANRGWMEPRAFGEAFQDFKILDISRDEPGAANVLRIGDTLLMPSSFPRTRRLLEDAGFEVRHIDISELQKAEAAMTCSSLIFEADT